MTLTNHNLLKIKFLKIRSAKGLFAQAISQAQTETIWPYKLADYHKLFQK